MNYDQPRQILDGPDTGKWHYTTSNKRTGIHPIGYCSGHDPHDTEAEARLCYSAYRRDTLRMGEGRSSWTNCGYPGCDQPANNIAQSGAWALTVLCTTHFNTTDAVTALGLDQPAGDSMHS